MKFSRWLLVTSLVLPLLACGGGGGGGADDDADDAIIGTGTGTGTGADTNTSTTEEYVSPLLSKYHIVKIDTTEQGDSSSLKVATNGSGDSVSVWLKSIDGTKNLYANIYAPDTGWSTAASIQLETTQNASLPSLAIDGDGNAIAVWVQRFGLLESVWANRYTRGSGWGGAFLLETAGGDATNPVVEFDSNGNAFIAWHQNDVHYYFSPFVSRYDAVADEFSVPLKLTENDRGDHQKPVIKFDAAGDAVIVWRQQDNFAQDQLIWADYYTSGSWAGAEVIENTTDDWANLISNLNIALTGGGDAILSWVQDYKVWYKSYSTSTWGVKMQMPSTFGIDTFESSSNMSTVLAAYVDGDNSFWIDKYDFSSGVWLGAELVAAQEYSHMGLPVSATYDEEGNIFLLWGVYEWDYDASLPIFNVDYKEYLVSSAAWESHRTSFNGRDMDTYGGMWWGDYEVSSFGPNSISVGQKFNGTNYEVYSIVPAQ